MEVVYAFRSEWKLQDGFLGLGLGVITVLKIQGLSSSLANREPVI